MSPSKLSALLTVCVVSLLLVFTAEGQSPTPSCAESLVPCANYINSTNPPSSCCEPLNNAIKTQLACLCNLYNTPALLQSMGINITDAVSLPSRCKLSAGLNSCVKASSPTSSSPPPPASPSNVNNGVSRMVGPRSLSILLFWSYVALF